VGRFQRLPHGDAELTPVTIKSRRGETVVSADEYPKHGTTTETLAGLRPAFDKEGTVTAGNASGINDGGAALVLMSAAEAEKRGIAPMARIVAWATAGVDPAIMGSGPIPASRAALERAGWSIGDLDLIATRWVLPGRGCSPPCSTVCSSATPRRASPHCASAAAWASPCACNETEILTKKILLGSLRSKNHVTHSNCDRRDPRYR